MGYTHYAYIPVGTIEDAQWSYLQNQIMALTLTDDWEEKEVNITADLIQVKGNHEWFVIPRECDDSLGRDVFFTFTKTAHKPYDYIIVACYMALYRAVDGVKLSSDGDYNELADGRQHYADTFGLSDAQIQELFTDTIHDRRPEWYIGDPIYAIAPHQWDEFMQHIPTTRCDSLDDNGIEIDWNYGYKIYVYNSGMEKKNDSINIHGLQLKMRTGLLCVIHAGICNGDREGGVIVRSLNRPVFDIDSYEYPHVTLTLGGYTAHALDGNKVECVACDEWWDNNDMQTDANGFEYCFGCYEEVEEGVDE